MTLGLGCVTMATMTTRILERRRDRLLVTLQLALAVPCSAWRLAWHAWQRLLRYLSHVSRV